MNSSSHLVQSLSGQHVDPVCGMTVNGDSEFKEKYQNKDYFFCSEHCQKAFLSHPEDFQMKKNDPQVAPSESRSALKTYSPLILILVYLIGGVLLAEVNMGGANGSRMMA